MRWFTKTTHVELTIEEVIAVLDSELEKVDRLEVRVKNLAITMRQG